MKILIIGLGGIGSFLVSHLQRAFNNDQFSADVIIADHDNVELKNIKYQNFTKEDVLVNKAEALAKRCSIVSKAIIKKITNENIKGYDIYVLCVDNFETRREVIEYCYKNNKHFIDLRAEGRSVFAMTKNSSLVEDLKTLNDDSKSGSCQKDYELENNIIQYGNLIISAIGLQLILNYLRYKETGKRILLHI